jgi:hypothetical protein
MDRIADLTTRARVVNPILYCKSLGQQYMVDQFAKVELLRLRYIEDRQKELRAEVYSGANDAMKSDGEGLKGCWEKVIMLPLSFTLGSRYITSNTLIPLFYIRGWQPASICHNDVQPVLPEIQNNLIPGETALDRPDLVA